MTEKPFCGYTIPKLCGNCRHWKEDDQDSEGPFGLCGRVGHINKATEHTGSQGNWTVIYKSDKAAVKDASDYFAALLCRSDFGCVLWEGK